MTRGGGGSVGPGAMTLSCQLVAGFIQAAYVMFANGVESSPGFVMTTPIDGGPDWIESERYSISAKAEGRPSEEMMQGPMLQRLLEDRFKLKIRRLTRDVPIFNLVASRSGHKLKPFQAGSCLPPVFPPQRAPDGQRYCDRSNRPNGGNAVLAAEGVTLDEFAGIYLSASPVAGIDRPVVDKTGLQGAFTIRLEFAAAPRDSRRLPPGVTLPERPAPTAPEIFTALEEQLGLKLEATRGQGTYYVIDSIERPTEN